MLCNTCFGRRRGILVKIQLGLNLRQINDLKIYFSKKVEIKEGEVNPYEENEIIHKAGQDYYVKINTERISELCDSLNSDEPDPA